MRRFPWAIPIPTTDITAITTRTTTRTQGRTTAVQDSTFFSTATQDEKTSGIIEKDLGYMGEKASDIGDFMGEAMVRVSTVDLQ